MLYFFIHLCWFDGVCFVFPNFSSLKSSDFFLIYHYYHCEFFTLVLSDGFTQKSKHPRVCRTLLSIRADFDSAMVWMVSILPLIFNSSIFFSKPLESVPTATSITVTFMFHSFFNSLTRTRYLSIFSRSFTFTLLSDGTAKSFVSSSSLLLLLWLIYRLLFTFLLAKRSQKSFIKRLEKLHKRFFLSFFICYIRIVIPWL